MSQHGVEPGEQPEDAVGGQPRAHGAAGATPQPPLRKALEAILLVVDEPVTSAVLAEVLERSREDVEQVLQQIAGEWRGDGRGFELRQVAGGWRLYSAEDCAGVVERFVLDGQSSRLSQAALETLAVVAYQQPVSRSRVAAVRGVSVDGVMRTLLARRLVAEAGVDPQTGATLYTTTSYFLERLGLNELTELPPLAPLLPDVASLEATGA